MGRKTHRILKTTLTRYCSGDHVKGEMDKGYITCGKFTKKKKFVGNPKENLQLGRHGCRQEDNIKTDSCTKELESVD